MRSTRRDKLDVRTEGRREPPRSRKPSQLSDVGPFVVKFAPLAITLQRPDPGTPPLVRCYHNR